MRRFAAEALGSLLLAGTVVGSGIMASRMADGNDAVALLANAGATAAMLYVLIVVFGPVSGAHFNPAVTAVAALRRELRAVDAAAYAAAQVAGCCAGAIVAHAMFGAALVETAKTVRTGPAQWLSEAVATFALVFAILGAARFRPNSAPAIVALVIAAGYWWTASTSFANPAITIARTLTDTFSGIRPADAPGFIAGQFVGAFGAWGAAFWLFTKDRQDERVSDRHPPQSRVRDVA